MEKESIPNPPNYDKTQKVQQSTHFMINSTDNSKDIIKNQPISMQMDHMNSSYNTQLNKKEQDIRENLNSTNYCASGLFTCPSNNGSHSCCIIPYCDCSSCGNCDDCCSGCGDCGDCCSGCGDCCSGCGDCCSGCGDWGECVVSFLSCFICAC